MSIGRGVDKDVVFYTKEYYLTIKKNETMSFVATQIDLDIIVLSKSDSKREISYIAYMWDLKK